jgi:integrase
MSVADRWHLARPPAGAKTCGKHKGKVPSAEHGTGLRWQVRGIDDRGMPVKRNFEYEDDAKAFDAELKSAVRAGTYVDDKAGKVTFQEYAEQWRRGRTHGHATAERVERGLRNNVYPAPGSADETPMGRKAIGGYPMGVLSRRVSLTREWIADLPLQANTALLLIDTVSAVFEAAIDDRIIARNPVKAKSVGKPKYVRGKVAAWSAEQVEAVAGALPERMAAMILLGAVTGMRQGELFGLALEDISWPGRTVRVQAQVIQLNQRQAFAPIKNETTRDVPVAAGVIEALSIHQARFPATPVTLPWSHRKNKAKDGRPVTRNLLFADPRGLAWNKQTVNRQWHRAWQAAGIPDLGRANGMHVLRHTAASRWLSGGLNVAKVADYLGDTTAMVLKTYAHYMPGDDKLGRAIMDDFLDPSARGSGASERPQRSLRSV